MRKIILIFLVGTIGAILIWAGIFYWQNLRGARPAFDGKEQKVISIPIPREPGGKRPPEGTCRPTGCSGEICADKDTPVFSICLWREEYACYRTAVCERQDNGECGWTKTLELESCLRETRME